MPYNQLSLWNKYQIDPIWGAGLGIIYFGDSYASSDDTVRLPGFVRVDAALYVKINETWRGQLNIENIFDKGYWASADGNNNISPGQPRTFKVSATAKVLIFAEARGYLTTLTPGLVPGVFHQWFVR